MSRTRWSAWRSPSCATRDRSPTWAPAPASRGSRSRWRCPPSGAPGREPAAQVRVPAIGRARPPGIENAKVVCARAEEWREGSGANDVVVARALARSRWCCEYAAPLLRSAGRWSTGAERRGEVDERDAAAAAESSGCGCARSDASSRTRARAITTCMFPQGARDAGALPAPAGDGAQAPAGGVSAHGRAPPACDHGSRASDVSTRNVRL